MTAKRVLNRVLSRRSDQTADPHLPRGSSKLGPRWKNVAELIDHLGGISADRIRLYPTPGTATETDYLRVIEGIDRWPAELIDGVIVESALYARSSVLATYVLCRIANWVHETDAGICVGGMCPFRFRRNFVLIPNVSIIKWRRIPDNSALDERIASFIPNLVVEVLRPDNTQREIDRKLQVYFGAGVKAAWIIDPMAKCASIHHSPRNPVVISAAGNLTSDQVLPGFRLRLGDVFGCLKRRK